MSESPILPEKISKINNKTLSMLFLFFIQSYDKMSGD